MKRVSRSPARKRVILDVILVDQFESEICFLDKQTQDEVMPQRSRKSRIVEVLP